MARRRYRLFIICAAVILFLLYRVSQNTWEDSSHYTSLRYPPTSNSPAAAGVESQTKPVQKPESEPEPKTESKTEPKTESKAEPKTESKAEPKAEAKAEAESKPKPKPKPKSESKPETEHVASQQKQSKLDDYEEPGVKIPKLKDLDDSKPPVNGKAPTHGDAESSSGNKNTAYDEDEEIHDIHQKNPPKTPLGIPADTRVHWRPVTEHFPVPTESIISLPTGKPLKVPRVQHEFGVESPEAKSKRVNRQERVGKEIERAWSGYKKFAWMHDELSPVSAKHRDPFCGWAATLVDSLDTLWIAGLKEEFDEAAKAVEEIDFTTTPRNNIPVFETTIRYLGGLLGAFDVSGGHDGGYPMLLRKAVQLAELLMGIFDTPNRMPLLYYQWQPEYASQPHRAGSVGIAELGTLSMEFTRLAQLTSENKYYDAVDRITNALIELQKAGTSIPGLFPENLDASGCNYTATNLRDSLSKAAQKQLDEDVSKKPVGYLPGQPPNTGPSAGEKPAGGKQAAEENEFIVGHTNGDDALARLQAADKARAKAMEEKAPEGNGFIVGNTNADDTLARLQAADKARAKAMEEKAAGKPAEKSNGFVVGKIGSEDPDDGQTPSAKPNTEPSGFVVGKIGSEDPFDQVESIDEASAKPQGFVVGKIGSEDPRDNQLPAPPTDAESKGFVVGKIGSEDPRDTQTPAEAPSKFVVGKVGSEDPRDAQIPAEAPSNFVVGKIGSEDPRDNQIPPPRTDAEPKGFVVGKIGSEDPRDTQIPAEAPSKFVVGKIGAEDPRDNQKPPDASGAKSSGFVVGKIGTEDPDYAKQGPREDDKTETRPLDSSLRRRDVIPENNKPLERLGQVPNPKMNSRGMPPFGADGATSSFDCVPQGLVVGGYGFQQYHMGGGQDSAYEYFPKEYLLLGGLESKYKKLYEDTIEATNEWLLYRPMVDGDWDILFPAKVSTSGNPSKDLSATFEVTHLTCFIGGMYGLGGKIFGREKDLEIAKKLTDGCVWAYQSTISGIMPEGSQVLPCPSLDKCPFNETLWWENLDPAKEWRERQIAEWEEKKAELEKKQGKKTQPIDGDPRKTNDKDKETAGEALEQTAKGFAAEDSTGSSKPIHKRAAVPPPKDGMAPTYENFDVGSELPQSLKDKIGLKTDEQKKPAEVGIQRDPNAPVDSILEAHRLPPLEPEEQQIILPERPQSHEEFVKQRIMDWGFAPGVTHITSRQYILRPEAIESVWYMYRITGDPIWMEKGWTMFEATIRATRTEIANSAIDDVNSEEPGLQDAMESFWLAETLKYYYLLFSEPSTISLDEWVLNTEAHPFKRPGGSVIGSSI